MTGETRNAATPDVPTFAEAGLPGVTASDLLGSPRAEGHAAGDRRAINAAFAKALKDPDVAARLAQLGYLPIAGGPSDYAANLRSEIEKWGKVVRAANIKVD